MTYKEYMLTKNKYYVYKGETEEELISNIKHIFSEDSALPYPEYNQHYKPPMGTIFVGKDYINNEVWINSYTALYGWNIQFVKDIISDNIKFK